MFGFKSTKEKMLEDERKLLVPPHLPHKTQESEQENEPTPASGVTLEKGDFTAIVLALFSLVLPYLLAFCASLAIIFLFIRSFP